MSRLARARVYDAGCPSLTGTQPGVPVQAPVPYRDWKERIRAASFAARKRAGAGRTEGIETIIPLLCS